METKLCGKCNTVKSVSDFYKCAKRSDGLQWHCKTCVKGYKASNFSDEVYRDKHKQDEEWRARKRESNKRYSEANREKQREYGRQYYHNHKEEYTARWKQRLADGSYLTPARIDAVAKRKAQLLDLFVEDVDRQVVWERDEGTCRICGRFVPLDEMHLDHIIPLSKGGVHAYHNVQTLCAPCNLKKGAD